MRKPTISFAIVSFSLLVLAGCNTANQNTYSAATPVDARQAEIERLCKLQFYAAGGRPGATISDSASAYADCMLKYSRS